MIEFKLCGCGQTKVGICGNCFGSGVRPPFGDECQWCGGCGVEHGEGEQK